MTRRLAAIMAVDVSLLIDEYEARTAPADGRKCSSTSCLLSRSQRTGLNG